MIVLHGLADPDWFYFTFFLPSMEQQRWQDAQQQAGCWTNAAATPGCTHSKSQQSLSRGKQDSPRSPYLICMHQDRSNVSVPSLLELLCSVHRGAQADMPLYTHREKDAISKLKHSEISGGILQQMGTWGCSCVFQHEEWLKKQEDACAVLPVCRLLPALGCHLLFPCLHWVSDLRHLLLPQGTDQKKGKSPLSALIERDVKDPEFSVEAEG